MELLKGMNIMAKTSAGNLNNNQTIIAQTWGVHENKMFQYGINILLMAVGVGVLSLSSRATIMLDAVPITMQTLAVLMIAFLYGSKLGAATVAAWLGAGFLGAPVFALGAGSAYMFGPTGGYLAGFLVASFIVGKLSDGGASKNMVSVVFSMILGNIIIYAFGLAWLSGFLGLSAILFQKGLIPFLVGDAVKIIVATVGLPAIWSVADFIKKKL